MVMGSYSCCKEGFYGSGEIKSIYLKLDDFSKIELLNYCNIEIIPGTENKVIYSDYENIIDLLKFEITQDILKIRSDNENIVIRNSKAYAKIYVKTNISEISLFGSGDFKIQNSLDKNCRLAIGGSGNIDIIENTSLENVYANIYGSGNIYLDKINTISANCKIFGSGNIFVWVQEALVANIAGSGNIYYRGYPTNTTTSITGSGNIIHLY